MELQLGNNGGVSGDEHEAFNSGNKGKTIAIIVNRFCSLKSIIKLSLIEFIYQELYFIFLVL
jgi:hypothetical protein